MAVEPVLTIEDLRTYFYSRSKRAFIRSVDGVGLQVRRGETLGIVGESGSGKSVTALSVIGLIDAEPGVITGRVGFRVNGTEWSLLPSIGDHVSLAEEDGRIVEVVKDNRGWRRKVDRLMHGVRGREISMIFQNPRVSLNPFVTIGSQVAESVLLNTGIRNRREAAEKARYWLEQVRMDSPGLRFAQYPGDLSGGMCQRAMIAMALSSEPSLLIADEPTTGLDSTIQSKIVELLDDLKKAVGVTTVLISHDINVVARLSDSVAVMYGGTVLEYGPADRVLSPDFLPKHPYVEALLESIPSERHIKDGLLPRAIEGEVLDTVNAPRGCRFFDRCHRITNGIEEKCRDLEPDLAEISAGHQMRCWLHIG
ncbi:MAG: ABC transporter ATP-binding protein [bacterium]|nr:MAG: ABC transporter ATP-binding protein [bacterium]